MQEENGRHAEISFSLVMGILLTLFGSSMMFTFNTRVINIPVENVKRFLSLRISNATAETSTALYSVSSAVYLIPGAVGAFASGFVAEKVGRRNGLLLTAALSVPGAILFIVAYFTETPEIVYVGRIIVGLSNGISQGIAPIYLTEIAPVDWRGAVGACHTLAISSGLLVSNILTFKKVLGSGSLWLIAAGLGGVPPLVQLLLQWTLPESPRYLYLKGQKKEAISAHEKYDPGCSSADFETEMEEENNKLNSAEKFHFLDIIKRKYSRALLIACLIQVQLIFSGIVAIDSYTALIMKTAGLAANVVEYCVFGVSLGNVVANIVSLPLLEKFGRRSIYFWPTGVVCVCLFVLGVCVQLQDRFSTEGNVVASKVVSSISVAMIYAHSMFLTVGIANLAPLISGEIFREGPREAAYSMCQAVMWISDLLVTFIFPNVESKLKGIVFFIFLGFVLGVWIPFYFILPETKGLTVDQVCTEKKMEESLTCNCCWPRRHSHKIERT